LDNVVEAFQDLYDLFKTGNYAERMPEVANAVTTVYDLGFLDPAVDVLKHYGLIDRRKHNMIKRNIRERTEDEVQNVEKGIEKYASYQNAASYVLIFIGAVLILNSLSGITGFVIAEAIGTGISGIIGLALVIGGVVLFAGGIENKVIGSNVKKDPLLLEIAEDIGNKNSISRDVNHLITQLNKGNTNPGLGTKTVSKGIYELRGRNGGRVYYRKIDNDKYEILGYSDKESQNKVINRLKELYP
jgi:putative component of toxin-antitoxin plasmid stabilization module